MIELRPHEHLASRKHDSPLRPLLAITLGVVVPLVLAPRPESTGAYVILLVVTIYVGAQLGWVMMSRSPQVARFFGLLYFYLFLGLAPMQQLSQKQFPLPSALSRDNVQTSAVIVLVTVLVAEFSFFTARRRQVDTPPPAPRREIAPGRVKLLGGLAVAAMLYEIRRIGGFGVMTSSRDQLNVAVSGNVSGATTTSSQAIHAAILTTPILVAAYLLLICLRERLILKGRLVIALVALAALFARNPVVTARYAFGVAVVSLVIAFAWPLRTGVYRAISMASILGITVFFAIFNTFRFARSAGGPTSQIVSDPTKSLTHGDYDSFQQLVNTVSYTRSSGYTHGHQLLGEALFFVPRTVLPSRGSDSGVLVARSLGFQFTNLSCPLPAEAFVDFSWLGVVVYAGIAGFLWAVLDRAATTPGLRTSWVGLVAPVIAVTQIIILRGSLLQTVGGTVLTLVIVRLCTRPIRSEVPRKATGPGADNCDK